MCSSTKREGKCRGKGKKWEKDRGILIVLGVGEEAEITRELSFLTIQPGSY